MPSIMHEALIQIFQHRPSFVAELLDGSLGVEVPVFSEARLESGDLTDLVPTEYRADAVVVLLRDSKEVLAVIVEVQMGRDARKRWSWPVYLTTLRARLRCPAILLVVSVDMATATWCAAPIRMGHPGLVLRPVVLGPREVPVVIDNEVAAQTPELAVLSVLAHASDPELEKIVSTLPSAFAAVNEELATRYSDLVFVALPAAARRYLEVLMTSQAYEYKSEFVRRFVMQGRAEGKVEGKAEGRAEGEALALLAVLDARGIAVPQDARERIAQCTDLERLNFWIRRAATAGSLSDLFA